MQIINILDKKNITVLSLAMLVIYALGIYSLKFIQQSSFAGVIIFNPGHIGMLNFISAIISFFIFCSGFLLLFLIPGWIVLMNFDKFKQKLTGFFGFSFVVSLVILILITSVCKLIWQLELNRANFLIIYILFVFSALICLWLRPRIGYVSPLSLRFNVVQCIPVFIFVLMSIIFIFLFRYKIISEQVVRYDLREETILSIPLGEQPDDLEVFGLADSLKRHLLPYWDLEYADRFGFVFTDLPLYSFVSMFSLLFFGDNTTALNLTSISFIAILFLIILVGCRRNKYLCLIVCTLMFVGYLNFQKDVSAFMYVEHFFFFLVIVSYIYLLQRNYTMYLLFAATATLTRFYGIFFVLLGFLGAVAFFKKQKPEIMSALLKYVFIVTGFFASILTIGIFTGNLCVYFRTIVIEYFTRFDYFGLLAKRYPGLVIGGGVFSTFRSLQFLSWCLQSTFYIFPLLVIFGRDKEENFYSFVGLIYFMLVFFSQYQFERYVIFFIPITAIVVCSRVERWSLRSNVKGTIQSIVGFRVTFKI